MLVVCKFCGTEREIKQVSDPIPIKNKTIQYIPSFKCGKCSKANNPTFYNDIAKIIQDIAIRQALKYTILLNVGFWIITSSIEILIGF